VKSNPLRLASVDSATGHFGIEEISAVEMDAPTVRNQLDIGRASAAMVASAE